MIAAIVSAPVGLRNGDFPDSISWRTQPKAKMSERESAASPRSCSGDV